MPDPAEDFAAGLEDQLAAIGNPETNGAPESDPVLDWLKSEFDGFDATDRDGVAEHLEFLQGEAKKAKDYEARIQEMEARQVLAMQNQPAPGTPAAPAASEPTQSAAAAQAEMRRLEAIKLDPQLTQYLRDEYVTSGPDGTLYPKPVNGMINPQVVRACDIQNQASARQREIAQELTGNWYGVFEETLPNSKAFKELLSRVEAYEKRFEESLTPIQQNMQQAAIDNFNWQNKDVLFMPDPAKPGELIPSPAGELYGTLVSGGKYTKEEALEIVKPMAAKFAPPAAPAAAAPAKPKPARFIEPIARRMAGTQNGSKPTERAQAAPFEDPEEYPFRPTMSDVRRKTRQAGQG